MAKKRAVRQTKKATATPLANLAPTKILAIDIGGTKIKILATGQTEPRKAASGPKMTPARMVELIEKLAKGWAYEAVSIGLPAHVGMHGPRSEPGNLGPGWVGFNFAAAFDCPVRIINDAAMQALGSYDGGRMLFLGLGTGLGSALIAESVIIPLELGRLRSPHGETLGETLGRAGYDRLGKDKWRKALTDVVTTLVSAFVVDYVVLGGGNAKKVKELPPVARLGHNLTAFRGGFRLWSIDDVPTLAADGEQVQVPRSAAEWRII
jgi:polyphosphate glucokinase